MRTATTTKTVRTNTAPPVAMLTMKRILIVELGALLVLGVGLVDVAILLLLVLLVMAVTVVDDDEAVVIVVYVAAKRKKGKNNTDL